MVKPLAMKKSTIIASHLSMLALGAAVAFVSSKKTEESPAETLIRNSENSSVSRGSGGAGSMDSGSPRSRRETREGTERKSAGLAPTESFGKINKLGDTYERQRALMDFFDNLAPDDFASVADEFQRMTHYDNEDSEMELLFLAWAKKDPMTALAYIEENPDTRRNRDEVLETWAGADPAAAEKWAMAKHEGDGPNPYMAAIIKGIAATDISNASRLTANMPMSRERGQAIEAMAKALLMNGTEAAFAFPDTIKDETLKGGFVMMIAQNLARQDPQAAADWVASMDKGVLQERAAGQVAERLARVDVSKAADFVAKLQPEARANAAEHVIPSMSRSDIAGTAKWVSSMAGTPGYDKMVESFVWSCDERSPEQSAAWISGVANVEQQTRLYHRMLGNWARNDQNAVRNWVAANNVPENVRQRFSR